MDIILHSQEKTIFQPCSRL